MSLVKGSPEPYERVSENITLKNPGYTQVKVAHYLLFMSSPPKNKLGSLRDKKMFI